MSYPGFMWDNPTWGVQTVDKPKECKRSVIKSMKVEPVRPKKVKAEPIKRIFTPEERAALNKRGREKKAAVRLRLLQTYGLKCACCGETDAVFLTVHHKNGGGNAHRRLKSNEVVWREMAEEADPSKYEVLCFNCHHAVHTKEGCPHRKNRTTETLRPNDVLRIRELPASTFKQETTA